MLKFSTNVIKHKEIPYKSLKFRHYTPLRNSKSVHYIPKFVTSKCVTTVQFCKNNCSHFYQGLKKHRFIRYLAYSDSY